MRLYELCIVLGSALIAQADEAEDLCELSYTVNKVEKLPKVEDAWESAVWRQAETLSIDTFHPLGSDHRPKTQALLLPDGTSLAVMCPTRDPSVAPTPPETELAVLPGIELAFAEARLDPVQRNQVKSGRAFYHGEP